MKRLALALLFPLLAAGQATLPPTGTPGAPVFKLEGAVDGDCIRYELATSRWIRKPSAECGGGAALDDTDDLTEGAANLYYTNARARAALSAGANITYDSGTGVISASAPGETNTASNQGAGVGILDGKVSLDFELRSLVSQSNLLTVALDAGNKEIDFTVNPANFDLATLGGAATKSQLPAATAYRDEINTFTSALNVDESNFNLRDAEDDIQLQLIAGALNLFDTSGLNQTFRLDGGGLSFGNGHTLDFSQSVTWNGAVGVRLQLATDKLNMSTGAGFQVGGNDVLTTLTGQPLDAELTALAAIAANGVLARTGAGTAAVRTLTGDSEVVITNGDGVAGNPTWSLAGSLTRDSEVANRLDSAATAGADNRIWRSVGDTRNAEGTGVTIDDNDQITAPGGIASGDGTAVSGLVLAELTANGSNDFRIYGAASQAADGCIVTEGQPADDQILKGTASTTTIDGKTCRVMAWEADSGAGGGGGDPVGTNYEQSFTSQTSVVLTHPFAHGKTITNCYDGSGVELTPESVTIGAAAAYNVTVAFTTAQTGKCVVSGGGAGKHKESIVAQTSVTVLASAHGLGTEPVNNGCRNGSGNDVGPDDFAVNGSGDATYTFLSAFTGDCFLGN